MDDLLLENPVVFTHPEGKEWPPPVEWTNDEWRSWLTQHNKYDFMGHWTPEAIERYLTVDRFQYGLGWKRKGSAQTTWFYQPAPVAVPYHKAKVPNILFGGAAGGTKSHSARWDAYKHCMLIPDFRAIIMRRTHEELKRNHLDHAIAEAERLNAFFGREIVDCVPSEHEIRFRCHEKGHDAKIILGHCQNPGDEERYLGDSYDAFYPDEMATFEKKQITGVAGRLRTEKRGILARMAGTSNPGGANTLWLRDYFIHHLTDKIREENPRYKPENWLFLQAMLWDNPYYMDPDGTYTTYEDRLFDYDPERRKQLLMGDWSALTGQFFPEFSYHRHVKELFIPPGCKIERWIDWGYDPHYGVCYWVACLPNGRLYVFYEWKFNGASARQKLVAAEVAKRIKELQDLEIVPLTQTTRINRSIADPSMWGKDGHTGEDYAETFSRFGVSLTQADNERVLGWGRLRHWLKTAPDGLPWIVWHPRCATAIRTIPALIRDRNDPDDVDTSGEDHPADATRYGVMARPSPTRFERNASLIPAGTMAEIMAAMRQAEARPPGMVM